MVIAHAASAIWHHFHPWITQNRTWNQSPILAPKITEKSQKGTQSGSQEPPKMIVKSIKMHTWTSKCLLGDPLNPWITKMVSQVSKMEARGSQNDS